MRGFHLIRACFLLLAAVILIEVCTTMGAAVLCGWGVVTGRLPVGTCMPLGEAIREVWSEVLAAILALLLAAQDRPPGGGDE